MNQAIIVYKYNITNKYLFSYILSIITHTDWGITRLCNKIINGVQSYFPVLKPKPDDIILDNLKSPEVTDNLKYIDVILKEKSEEKDKVEEDFILSLKGLYSSLLKEQKTDIIPNSVQNISDIYSVQNTSDSDNEYI